MCTTVTWHDCCESRRNSRKSDQLFEPSGLCLLRAVSLWLPWWELGNMPCPPCCLVFFACCKDWAQALAKSPCHMDFWAQRPCFIKNFIQSNRFALKTLETAFVGPAWYGSLLVNGKLSPNHHWCLFVCVLYKCLCILHKSVLLLGRYVLLLGTTNRNELFFHCKGISKAGYGQLLQESDVLRRCLQNNFLLDVFDM